MQSPSFLLLCKIISIGSFQAQDIITGIGKHHVAENSCIEVNLCQITWATYLATSSNRSKYSWAALKEKQNYCEMKILS